MKRIIAVIISILMITSAFCIFSNATEITNHWTNVNIGYGGKLDGEYNIPENGLVIDHVDGKSVLIIALSAGASYEYTFTGRGVYGYKEVYKSKVTEYVDENVV